MSASSIDKQQIVIMVLSAFECFLMVNLKQGGYNLADDLLFVKLQKRIFTGHNLVLVVSLTFLFLLI
jgi:hypothetical protein